MPNPIKKNQYTDTGTGSYNQTNPGKTATSNQSAREAGGTPKVTATQSQRQNESPIVKAITPKASVKAVTNQEQKTAGRNNTQNLTTAVKQREAEKNRNFEAFKANYQYSDDDVINSVQYKNTKGDVISARDYNSQIEQWKGDVDKSINTINLINSNYQSGKYGYDDNAYERYVQDYNRALSDYNTTYAKKQYFADFNQAEFIDFQSEIDKVDDEILRLNAQLDIGRNLNGNAEQIADLEARIAEAETLKADLEERKSAQIRVQSGMAVENFEKEGGDFELLAKELNALDDTTPERIAKQILVNISRDTSNLIDLASAGIDVVNDVSGRVIKDVAEEYRRDGVISNERYNELIDASQELIDYNVRDDGLGSWLRNWSEEQQYLVGVGATDGQMLAVNLTAGAITMASEKWLLGPLYRPLRAVTGGVERYVQLTDRGVSPYVALGNASVVSASQFYLSQIPLEYESIVFQTMAKSPLTWEAMKFLTSRATNIAIMQGGASVAEYGVDWINNEVTEFLSGQDTGLNYSAGDLFRHMYMDMGQTFMAVMGRGTFQGGINSLKGATDTRDFGNFVNEFDLRMSIARKQLFVSYDNPYKDQILNRANQRYQETYQSPIPDTYLITTQQEYNQAKAERDLALQIYDDPNTSVFEKDIINQGVSAINNGLQAYEGSSVIANKIILQSDLPDVPSLDDARESMIESLTPNAEELLANNKALTDAYQSIEDITERQLIENNVVAEIEEFTGQSRETRDYVLQIGQAVGKLTNNEVKVVVDTTLTDKNGNPVAGRKEILPDGRTQIAINPYSKESGSYLFSHEAFHAIKGTEAEKRIIDFLDRNAPNELKRMAEVYANRYPEDQRPDEYYADLYGRMLKDKDLLGRLQEYDPSTFNAVREAIPGELYGIQPELDSMMDNIIYGLEEVANNGRSLTFEKEIINNTYDGRTINNFRKIQEGPGSDGEDQLYPGTRGEQGENDSHSQSSLRSGETLHQRTFDERSVAGGDNRNTGLNTFFVKTSNDVGLLNDSIDYYLERMGSEKGANAEVYIGYILASDFESVTSPPLPGEKYESFNQKKWDDFVDKNAYPMSLWIENESNGKALIWMKEGSHRMYGLSEGHRYVPIFIHNNKNYRKTKMDTLELYPQKDAPTKNSVIVHDVIPFSQEFRDDIIQKYGEGNGSVLRYAKDLTPSVADDQGRLLTKAQVSFFKNESPLFKTKDNKLLNFFHSTPNKFDRFDKSKIGSNTLASNTAYGFYFTPSKAFSERFKNIDGVENTNGETGYTMEAYLFSEKPIIHPYQAFGMDQFTSIDKDGEELDQLVIDWLKATGTEEGIDYLKESMEEWLADGEKPKPGDLYRTFIDVASTDGNIFDDAERERTELQKRGYDSIVLYEGTEEQVLGIEGSDKPVLSYIVFEPEQIIDVNNPDPSNSNDTYYAKDLDPDEVGSEPLLEENLPIKKRGLSKKDLNYLEKQEKQFRESVKGWAGNYDVLRTKYDLFDQESFDQAIADVYVGNGVSPETKEKLYQSLVSENFDYYAHPEETRKYVDAFAKEVVDYYILETQYRGNQKYEDSITKTANIVNQAQDNLYENDYDRSLDAKLVDQMVKNLRVQDYDSVYEYVQEIIDGISDKKNIFYNRDLKEYNDLVADGNEELRQKMNDLLEQPVRVAQTQELAIIKEELADIKKLQKQTGIKMYSKEDNAIGWYIEGKKQDGTPYGLEDLEKDFPDKWKDIKLVADYYSDVVERWYNEEIETREKTYGDLKYQNDVRTSRLENEVESAKAILAKRELEFREKPNRKTQAGYSKAQKALATAEKKLNAQLQRNLEHDATRRQFTPYRQNYFHHTNEVDFIKNAKALYEQIRSGSKKKSKIPTELAGRTEFTKPKSTIQSYMWKQGRTNYSSSGFASLRHRLLEHANAVAFDPAINYLRNVEFVMRDLDAESKASNYVSWLTKYTNNLAGKTNDLDRVIREMTPDETLNVLRVLNDRAKKNAVYGNVSSAIVQAGNFPVGMALAVKNGGKEAIQDLTKGVADYYRDSKSGTYAKDLSTFLQLRYLDTQLDDSRFSAKLENAGNWMMEVLDKKTAEVLWYTFKAQGERLGVEDPLLYADEMVDRSIQGRRPEDLPLSQQSEIVRLLAPFQVEVNNQWQVMKDLTKGAFKKQNRANSIGAMITLMITSALMNIGFEKIINRKPLFDPLGAIIEALQDDEITDAQLVGRVAGEVMGAMPYGQYLPALLGFSDEEAEKYFGESDPSRYGTGNIGISAIAELMRAENDEQRVKALEDLLFTYGMPGFGKQTQRVYRSGQDFGYVPKYVNGEWRRDPIHYTSSGGVGFVNDPKDVFDFMNSIIGGSYSTKAGKEYIESDFSKLGIGTLTDPNGDAIRGSKALQVRKEMQEMGIYESVVEQINEGKMSAQQAGLSDKVIGMSDDEFNDAYSAMQIKAEGLANKIREQYNWNEEQAKQYQDAVNIEADYKDGKKVTDSEALKTRKAMEDAGIYKDVLDYIQQNGLDYTDVGLGKRVVNYDQDKFLEVYAKKISGE